MVLGKYVMTKSENFDEYMKEVGVNFMLRKLAGNAKHTTEIFQDGQEFRKSKIDFGILWGDFLDENLEFLMTHLILDDYTLLTLKCSKIISESVYHNMSAKPEANNIARVILFQGIIRVYSQQLIRRMIKKLKQIGFQHEEVASVMGQFLNG